MPPMSEPFRKLTRSSVYGVLAGRVVLPWALQGVRPSGCALEIGAGSGVMATCLLARFAELRLVVTDHDPGMIADARRRLSLQDSQAAVWHADAAALPFSDGEFDMVLSFGMLHHVGTWKAALCEAVRVLRPGGRLVGYDLLDTCTARWVHRIEGPGELTAFRVSQLQAELTRLAVTEVITRRSMLGMAVRFSAIKKLLHSNSPALQAASPQRLGSS